jgi:hypothetical protein
MTTRQAEQQELQRALELLGRNTRPGRLLEFLATKYLAEEEAQLTEFDIAREVFGRSLENFDPGADAVVRVETHRLRKKLREIYEKDSQTRAVQISLPAGTYVPKFTVTAVPDDAQALAHAQASHGKVAGGLRRIAAWGWSLLIIAVVSAIGVGVWMKERPPPSMPRRAQK